MLYCPARSPFSASRRFPGIWERSARLVAASSISSFLRATRSMAWNRRTRRSWNNASVSRQRNVLIIPTGYSVKRIPSNRMGHLLLVGNYGAGSAPPTSAGVCPALNLNGIKGLGRKGAPHAVHHSARADHLPAPGPDRRRAGLPRPRADQDLQMGEVEVPRETEGMSRRGGPAWPPWVGDIVRSGTGGPPCPSP